MKIAAFVSSFALVAAVAPIAGATEFSAPTGQLGAGLQTTDSTVRVYGEMGFHTQSYEAALSARGTSTSLSWVFGAGVQVSKEVEIEVQVPVAFGTFDVGALGGSVSTDNSAVGNLSLGANWFSSTHYGLWKIGGAVAFGPWNGDIDSSQALALQFGAAARGGQDLPLWSPNRVSLIVPARFEFGEKLRFTGDANAALLLPTDDASTQVVLGLAPGVSWYVTRHFILGARVPFQFFPTVDNQFLPGSNDDRVQISVEPFLRGDVGPLFLSTRFLVNVDEPFGPSFDSFGYWGWMFGVGITL